MGRFNKILEKLFGKKETKATIDDDILTENEIKTIPFNEKQQNKALGYVKTSKLNLTPKTVKELKEEFFIIDTETTGLDRISDRIVELGIIRYKDGKIVDEFNTLINPGFSMPKKASEINKITNAMLHDAPTESSALSSALSFLDPVLKGKTIIGAHNADFDIEFLANALERNGYSANIKYVDTLANSIKLVRGTPNHKLGTLANYFRIINNDPHRASGDAKTCGELLLKLMDILNKKEKEQIEEYTRYIPSNKELEVCAFIQNIILSSGMPTDLLRFYKKGSGYISVSYPYTAFKFKLAKKGRYIVVPIQFIKNIDLPITKATMSEGGSLYKRIFFNSYEDLTLLKDFFTSTCASCLNEYEKLKKYSLDSNYFEEQIDYYCPVGCRLTEEKMLKFLEKGKNRKSVHSLDLNLPKDVQINIADLELNPIHNRVPLNKIKNNNDWQKGINEGFPLFEKGDRIRKEGKIKEAIALFDEARFKGYVSPALYESYAMAYHKLKDYENEVAILNEGLKRLTESHPNLNIEELQYSKLHSRREKAAILLLESRK
ncbi:exonuclease domain-containing protein [Facklamia hominis]|uniref:DNA polymerase III polC-type n=1 Tax=Facklamia hominis TaxID=178214 RepID=A0AAJ1Q5T3_9LACT|nr:exonuclease domain-containing protein [Facklamia hominis]MDK7187047.1 exonuclease domain-containing protein [Facklamia hominis]